MGALGSASVGSWRVGGFPSVLALCTLPLFNILPGRAGGDFRYGIYAWIEPKMYLCSGRCSEKKRQNIISHCSEAKPGGGEGDHPYNPYFTILHEWEQCQIHSSIGTGWNGTGFRGGGGRGGVGADGDYYFRAHATSYGGVNVVGRLFNFLFFSDLV